MSFDGILCAKESRGIEEIKDVQEENLVKGYANYIQNIGGKHEKIAITGKIQMNLIQHIFTGV
jgi:hypothetical protein